MSHSDNVRWIWNRLWGRKHWQDKRKKRDGILVGPYVVKVIEWNLEIKSDMKILEPGCGLGSISLELARRGANVVLVDFSSAAIKIAKGLAQKSLLHDVDFILGDVRCLSLKDDYFDLVWNEGVVEHFKGEERQRVIDEMARVVKADKVVMIITPNRLNPIYRIWKKIKLLFGTWEYGFEDAYLSFELVDAVEKAGLKVVKIGGIKALASVFLLLSAGTRPIKQMLERSPSWISVNSNLSNLLNRTLGSTLVVISQKEE